MAALYGIVYVVNHELPLLELVLHFLIIHRNVDRRPFLDAVAGKLSIAAGLFGADAVILKVIYACLQLGFKVGGVLFDEVSLRI